MHEPTSQGGAGTEHDAWREVGQQIEQLGRSLARAIEASWQSEETQRHLRAAEAGLRAMADELGEAIRDAVPKAEAEELKQQAERAARATRAAGRQAMEDMRPQLLTALRTVSIEIQRLIDRLEGTAGGRPAMGALDGGAAADVAEVVDTGVLDAADAVGSAAAAMDVATPLGAPAPQEAVDAAAPVAAIDAEKVDAAQAEAAAEAVDAVSLKHQGMTSTSAEAAADTAQSPTPAPEAKRRHWWQRGR